MLNIEATHRPRQPWGVDSSDQLVCRTWCSWLPPRAGARTFLAINDGKAGVPAATDALMQITGYSGDPGRPAVV
jgi:hypothetical protein